MTGPGVSAPEAATHLILRDEPSQATARDAATGSGFDSRPGLVHNPYWDAVKHHISRHPTEPGQVVRDYMVEFMRRSRARGGVYEPLPTLDPDSRETLVPRYQFTVTDPATVRFIRRHAGPAVLDPMAGSGYLCYLLDQLGVDSLAFDIKPWTDAHFRVHRGHAPYVTRRHGTGRTLILSWPDQVRMDEPEQRLTPAGSALAAYTGNTVIFIGDRSCCGGQDLWRPLRSNWHRVAVHLPVRWLHATDTVEVFTRVRRSSGLYLHIDDVVSTDPLHLRRRINALALNHNIGCLTYWSARADGAYRTSDLRGLVFMADKLETPENCRCNG